LLQNLRIINRAEIEHAPKQFPTETLDVLSKQKYNADYLLRKGMFVEAELYKQANENVLELVKVGEYDVQECDPLAYARLSAMKVAADVVSVGRLDSKSCEIFLGTDALWNESSKIVMRSWLL